MRQAAQSAKANERQAILYVQKAKQLESDFAKQLCYDRAEVCRERARQNMETYEAYYRGERVGVTNEELKIK